MNPSRFARPFRFFAFAAAALGIAVAATGCSAAPGEEAENVGTSSEALTGIGYTCKFVAGNSLYFHDGSIVVKSGAYGGTQAPVKDFEKHIWDIDPTRVSQTVVGYSYKWYAFNVTPSPMEKITDVVVKFQDVWPVHSALWACTPYCDPKLAQECTKGPPAGSTTYYAVYDPTNCSRSCM